MPDDRSISQLTTAEQTSANDLFETAIPNAMAASGYVSRKVPASDVANLLLKNITFPADLETTAKAIIPAINEAAQSGGGGASVIQKTLAEYNALPTADKMNGSIYKITDKALIYCLDEEYHALKEITSAEYAQLTPAEQNNGTIYVKTDEETTASDIPYSAGVSVADKLDSLNNDLTITKIAISDFIQLASDVSIDGRSAIYKQGKHIWLNIYGSITGTFTQNVAKSIGTVKSGYVTENLITTICGIHNSMWGVSAIGYLFFNTDGSFQISTATQNMNNFKVSLDYCIA